MREEEIRRLVKIVEESGIAELEISGWGKTIKITKNITANSTSAAHLALAQTVQAAPQQSQPEAEKIPEPVEEKPAAGKNTVEIKSPMVGTFYRAPSPEIEPYVEVGKVIKKGQVLCIIEAMKLMNEIESEVDGRIVEILIENSQPVEYNQPLFVIEPA